MDECSVIVVEIYKILLKYMSIHLCLHLFSKSQRLNFNLEGMAEDLTIPQVPIGRARKKKKTNLQKGKKSPKKESAPFKGQKDEVNQVISNVSSIWEMTYWFSMPNKRIMILRENGDIESESSQEETSTSTSNSESGYSNEEAPYEGDLLMVRRLTSTLVGDDQSQRENIFHCRCLIPSKCCSLIRDGRSSVNVASQRLVEKLSIPTIPHPKSYKIQWLSE
ncbi:hypothetical protein CR513_14025, partial [Mucuna pruriens]